MSERFFSATPIRGASAMLDGPEAHHVLHVMRMSVGDEVTLFDGSGAEFKARIARTGRSDIELEVIGREEIDRELPFSLILGVALPKGDRQRWLVEKGVELGVTCIVPLRTERSVAEPTAHALERLRRSIIEASKQCGRNRLLQIAEASSCPEFFESAPPEAQRLIAHPGESSDVVVPAASTFVAVGPEGGFTEAEISSAIAAGWQLANLGPRTLRTETAAITICAIVVDRSAIKT